LSTLQSKKFVTADFIADKYDINTRTVYRDLKALGDIGVPIAFEDNKGYSIPQGFFLPPVSLTREEANAIILVSSLPERFTDKTIKKHIENAVKKYLHCPQPRTFRLLWQCHFPLQ
jgi:predicted DNA-binding transcriptional regulator YafY